MPLSEHEQRMLEQIEQALYAEDPKFASSVRGRRFHKPSRGRRIQGVVLVLIGMILLPLGVIVQVRLAEIPILSVIGFLLMFTGVMVALMSFRAPPTPVDEHSPGKSGPKRNSKNSFTQRMEDRFRDRFEDR